MKASFHSFLLLFIAAVAAAQAPNLDTISGNTARIKAWIGYCESLRLNTGTAKNNYLLLQQAGMRGLLLAPANDEEDRARFFSYTALGYYYQLKFDSAQAFFYQSLQTAQKAHATRQIISACVALIPVNFQLQQTAKVEECRAILQSIADTSKNKSFQKDIFYALGSYYQQKSYYSTAQDYFIKSIQLREQEVDTTHDSKARFDYAIQCDMLSKLYLNTQMVDKSLRVLRQAERFASVSPNVSNRLLSSFVEAFASSGLIDSALNYNIRLENATRNSTVYPSEVVSSNLNIAIYYMDHHQYNKALPFLVRGDTIATRLQSPLLVFQAQMIKGRYMEETGQFQTAVGLLNQSLPVAKQFSRELYTNILKYLALSEKGLAHNEEALQYYQRYAEQSDSLSKEKLSVNFADQETRYETNQKEAHIAALDKENRLNVLELQTAGRTRWFLVLGLAALGVISLLLYLIYRNKEKVNKVLNTQNDQLEILNSELAVANDTKAKLFAIIGHDLRAPAGQIVELLQLQKERPELLAGENRTRHEEKLKTASENVLETMEDILIWSKSQMQHFTPRSRKTNISSLISKEVDFLQARIEEKCLKIRRNADELFYQETDENFAAVIIRNLLQNAVKYGIPDSEIEIDTGAAELRIRNRASAATAAELNALLEHKQVYSQHAGFGLQIARDLAAAIGVRLFFELSGEQQLSAVIRWTS